MYAVLSRRRNTVICTYVHIYLQAFNLISNLSCFKFTPRCRYPESKNPISSESSHCYDNEGRYAAWNKGGGWHTETSLAQLAKRNSTSVTTHICTYIRSYMRLYLRIRNTVRQPRASLCQTAEHFNQAHCVPIIKSQYKQN